MAQGRLSNYLCHRQGVTVGDYGLPALTLNLMSDGEVSIELEGEVDTLAAVAI